MTAQDSNFLKFCSYQPKYCIKDYGSKISWHRMKILEIQHFLELRGLPRAEIFKFENFHLQPKSARLRMFLIGLQQISSGATITKHMYPICFLQGSSWVCKRCTLFVEGWVQSDWKYKLIIIFQKNFIAPTGTRTHDPWVRSSKP